MITSDDYELFFVDSVNKQWTITATKTETITENGTERQNTTTIATITNADLLDGSLSITECISSDGLVFGRCEPSKIEFTAYNINTSLKGCTLNVSVSLNNGEPFQIGIYKVDSDKATADRYHRKITAYDALYEINQKDVTKWYKELSLPMSVKNFRNSFFTHVGVTQETVDLINDDINVNRTIDTSNDNKIKGSSIIQAICEINASFGHIGRDNVFHYIQLEEYTEGLYPSATLYPSDELYPMREVVDHAMNRNLWQNTEYEDYTTKKMDGVIVVDDSNQIKGKSSDSEFTNPYKIESNFISFDHDTNTLNTIATRIYNKIGKIVYMPYNVDMLANPCIEVGDSIRYTTKDKIIYSYVFNRTMSGIQHIVDNVEATGPEDLTERNESLASQIARLRDKSEYDFEANKAKFNTIDVEFINVGNEIHAVEAHIGSIYAQTAEIEGTLTAHTTRFEQNEQSIAANSEYLVEIDGGLKAQKIKVDRLDSDNVTINNILTAHEANITDLTAENVEIEGTLTAHQLAIDNLETKAITTENLQSSISTLNYIQANRINMTGSIYFSFEGRQYAFSPKRIYDGSGNPQIVLGA